MKISFCITCKGRLHHLKETLPHNLQSNPQSAPGSDRPDVEFVVVNYNSPDGLDEWIKTDPDMVAAMKSGHLVYARYDDAENFRHAHAKNMAHRLASGDVLCNLDADNFTGPGFASYLQEKMGPDPDKTFAHAHFGIIEKLPVENRGAFGRIALSRKNFMEMGGYAETLKHWGGEDGNLIVRCLARGLKPAAIDDPAYLNTIAHGNEERYQFTAQSDKQAAMERIRNAGVNFKWSSLKSRFQQVSGWVRANDGHFGEGLVHKGLDETPQRLGKVNDSSALSYRPTLLGAFPYFKIRAMPDAPAANNGQGPVPT